MNNKTKQRWQTQETEMKHDRERENENTCLEKFDAQS